MSARHTAITNFIYCIKCQEAIFRVLPKEAEAVYKISHGIAWWFKTLYLVTPGMERISLDILCKKQ